MDWRVPSRSQSRARGSGMGMGAGMGIGMDWRPGSRSQSRSRPSHLHLQTTGIHGFDFDDTASNSGSVSTTANIEGGVAIPQSVRANGQGAGGAGSGGSGRSLLTRSLQMFSESPPVVGYGGWTNISRLAAPQPQHTMRQIGEVVPPQHATSSDEEQQQAEQQEAQDEEDFGGFMSASLPAFHLGFSFAQPLATTATATASPFSRHVRSMSLDHSNSGDGSATLERPGGPQRPLPPKVPESTLVSYLINV
jgi:hypothetical protein